MSEIVAASSDPRDVALRLFFQHGTRAAAVALSRLARAEQDGAAEQAAMWKAVLAAMETRSGEGSREKMLARWTSLAQHEPIAPRLREPGPHEPGERRATALANGAKKLLIAVIAFGTLIGMPG